MKDLFDAAKAAQRMPLEQVDELFACDLYEARLAAPCILDIRARSRRATEADRRTYYETYLRHLDRITTWDMVDRAAPSVVGGHLLGRSTAPLLELARATQPLRRRTAITAPCGSSATAGTTTSARCSPSRALLARDAEPVVHKAVGIALKHAGGRDPVAVERFLDEHVARMPRFAVRSAAEKLPPGVRARFVG